MRLTLPPEEHLKLVEERRKAGEAVLWQLPSFSLAAQAFLLSVGLGHDAEPGAQIVVGALGVVAVVATGFVVLYQALRATTLGRWVRASLSQPLAPEDFRSQAIGLNRTQKWLLDHVRNAFYFPWAIAGAAFLIADGYVFGLGAGWW